MRFGPPRRFDGHGILLPCISGEQSLRVLRGHVLHPPAVRAIEPHLTLAQPGNQRAPRNHIANAASLSNGLTICFAHVRMIQQRDAAPWIVLHTIELPQAGQGAA